MTSTQCLTVNKCMDATLYSLIYLLLLYKPVSCLKEEEDKSCDPFFHFIKMNVTWLIRVHYQQKHFVIKFITLSQTVLLVDSLLRTICNENHWYNNSLCLNVWEYGISSYSSLMKITLY